MAECFVAAGRAAWGHIVTTDFLAGMNPPDRWRDSISRADEYVLVAESDGLVQGFAVLRRSGDEDADGEIGELDSFYVHPSVWGRGVGNTLLAAAIDRLRSMGFKHATLWTAELNHRPRRIYEAAGWQVDGARRERTLRGSTFAEVRYRILISDPTA
jgi:GNAT superfamily N-acetyltransferase